MFRYLWNSPERAKEHHRWFQSDIHIPEMWNVPKSWNHFETHSIDLTMHCTCVRAQVKFWNERNDMFGTFRARIWTNRVLWKISTSQHVRSNTRNRCRVSDMFFRNLLYLVILWLKTFVIISSFIRIGFRKRKSCLSLPHTILNGWQQQHFHQDTALRNPRKWRNSSNHRNFS